MHIARHFTRWHLAIALVLWLLFSGLTFWIAINAEIIRQAGRVIETTAATLLGPMTGAVSRGMQSCCLSASMQLLPYCGAALAAGTALQLVPLPDNRWSRAARLAAWFLGLFTWFAGGILSFLHVLT